MQRHPCCLRWDPSRLYGPRAISTPDLVGDIQRYFHPEGDVRPLLALLRQGQRDKLAVLVERVEFIEHLRHLVGLLTAHKRRHEVRTPLDKTHMKVTQYDEIVVSGYDYAGVDYDIEALVQYLLLTCIDTIKGELTRRAGYTALFTSAFTHDLSPALRRRFTEGFAVLRVVGGALVPDKVAFLSQQHQVVLPCAAREPASR